ncbi:MAG TPA: UbiH/UbiF/VisC/COQ6 family ubiquinone biosynthesis hydroxylase [Pseudomonadales bacterium]
MSVNADIVIAGAGLAGSALAIALGKQGWDVLLLDPAPAVPADAPAEGVNGFDLRVSALSAGSIAFLNELGAWPQMQARRATPFAHMSVRDAEGTASVEFNAADVQVNELGFIVENRVTLQALDHVLQTQGRVRCLRGVGVADAHRHYFGEGHATHERIVKLDNGDTVNTQLLVGADGARSWVRELAGFNTREWEYGHRAIVATIQLQQPHQHTAWQWFHGTGPLAFLPLDDGTDASLVSIVWSCTQAEAERLMTLNDDAFADALTRASQYTLGKVLAVSTRAAFPLKQSHATDYVQPGIALVADAAHTLHPLAGQGINLGLKDVKVLAEELHSARNRGLSPGEPAVLERYQRRRKGDNLLMMATMEGFKRLFEERALPVRWLRNTGMRLFDASGPIKRQLVKQAMGL